VAKPCTNRKSFPPMNASLLELPSLFFACCDRKGCKSGYLCTLVCARFESPNLLFAERTSQFIVIFACIHRWILLQSFYFDTGFSAKGFAYSPNSIVVFSA
jgi:hypothetical protein